MSWSDGEYENIYDYDEYEPIIQGNLNAGGLVAGARKKSMKLRKNGLPRSINARDLEAQCLINITNVLDKYYNRLDKLKGKNTVRSINSLKGAIKKDEDKYRMIYDEVTGKKIRKPKKVVMKKAPSDWNKFFGKVSKIFSEYEVKRGTKKYETLFNKLKKKYYDGEVKTLEDIREVVHMSSGPSLGIPVKKKKVMRKKKVAKGYNLEDIDEY